MTDPARQSDPSPDESLPPSLVRDLRALHAVPPMATEALDDAIHRLGSATRVRTGRPPFRGVSARRLASIGGPLAAAAAIAVVVVITRPSYDPSDLDRDGRITILDAFALARTIDSGRATRAGWDRNADGTVDAHDADAIALAAVSLDHFTASGGS